MGGPLKSIRTALVDHFEEAQGLLRGTLADVDFDEFSSSDPGELSEEQTGRFVLYFQGLSLLKARIHIAAVLRANEQNNVHSLGVHARVLIECAAEVVVMGHAAVQRTPKALERVLNAQEFDTHQLLRRITRGQISSEELEASTTRAREGIGLFDGKQPRGTTIADRVSILAEGKAWYDYLSRGFCDSGVDALRKSPGSGGVLPAPKWQFDLAFAVILNCALTYVCQMLLAYGVLRIQKGAGSELFDAASSLFERVRETAAPVRSLHQGLRDDDPVRTGGGAAGGA